MVVNTTEAGDDEHSAHCMIRGESGESEEYEKWKLTHSNKS